MAFILSPQRLSKFMKYVEKTDTCWNWIGGKAAHGYGQFMFLGKQYRAHRFSYETFKGEILAGLVIDHICHNKGCVNPDHLEAVTVAENNRRYREFAGITKPPKKTLQIKGLTCRNGHELTPDNIKYLPAGKGKLSRRCLYCYNHTTLLYNRVAARDRYRRRCLRLGLPEPKAQFRPREFEPSPNPRARANKYNMNTSQKNIDGDRLFDMPLKPS